MTGVSYEKEGIPIPKQTFHNLPAEKKDKIIRAALEEFTERTFTEASIACIVRASGIPRGSFYQYFDDKMDLYKHLFTLVSEEKMAYFKDVFDMAGETGFFGTYSRIMEAGLRFNMDNPGYGKLGMNFFAETSEFKKAVSGEKMEDAAGIFRHLLGCGMEKGEIRRDIDLDLWAYLICQLQFSIGEYCMGKDCGMDDVVLKIQEMLDVLKHGLSMQGGET
ncbi:MAG: TetR/AcrR family transcriptional regulator [Clostridia bacterium]